MYDLCIAKPHAPPDARFSARDSDVYQEGYSMALVMALRVMENAATRFALYGRTRRLEAQRRRGQT